MKMLTEKVSGKILALSMLFAFVLSLVQASAGNSLGGDDVLRLNPAYKLKRMSNGEVIIYEKDQDPTESDFSFFDFYADVLLAAFRNQRVAYVVSTMSDKYLLSDDECRRELKHVINVLSEWDIILTDRELAER